MALIIEDCLIPKGSGTNFMYGDCCCSLNCTLTNETGSAIILDFIFCNFQNGQFTVISEKYFYQGVQITTFPFVIPPNESIQTAVDYCAGNIGTTDTLMIYTEQNGGEVELYFFDFEAIDLSTSVTPTTFNFGDVIIGQTGTLEFEIDNPTACCLEYATTTTCPETVITPDLTSLLCTGDSQPGIKVDFTPTTVGTINCEIFVSVGCQTLSIPVTGSGKNPPEPPSGGGNNVSGKRTVVDCPTSNCRLANQQPGFAQTTKNSINQISRVTRPKGGAGRGTNFR